MEQAPRSEAEGPRELALKLDVLQSMLSREQIYDLDVEAELTRLRNEDPVTDVIIRYFIERYFPGHISMAQKEKAARVMLAAFRMRERINATLKDINLSDILRDIDELTSPPPLEEPPEIIGN